MKGNRLLWMLMSTVLLAALFVTSFNNYEASVARANYGRCVSVLRQLVEAQNSAMIGAQIDLNRDGMGDPAYLGELLREKSIRGSRGQDLLPMALMKGDLTALPGGVYRGRGFDLVVYLPDGGGIGRVEGEEVSIVDWEQASLRHYGKWCAYAVPNGEWGSIRMTCFVNQRGEVLRCSPEDGVVYGPDEIPTAGAAFLPPVPGDEGDVIVGRLAIDEIGGDGNRWTPAQ